MISTILGAFALGMILGVVLMVVLGNRPEHRPNSRGENRLVEFYPQSLSILYQEVLFEYKGQRVLAKISSKTNNFLDVEDVRSNVDIYQFRLGRKGGWFTPDYNLQTMVEIRECLLAMLEDNLRQHGAIGAWRCSSIIDQIQQRQFLQSFTTDRSLSPAEHSLASPASLSRSTGEDEIELVGSARA
jgi:hypothetical protein